MKIVKIVIALLIIAGTAYWAFDSVNTRSYAGSGIEFTVGNGSSVSISHEATEPVLLDITASSSFAVTSSESDLSGSGTREGSGRNVVYRHQVELPAGTTDFRVTRGSNVTFAVDGAAEATVVPMQGDAARTTLIVAALVIIAALFYISRTLEHRWIKAIMPKSTPSGQTAAQT